MLQTHVHQYRDPTALMIGLGELRRKGLTPRGVLFLALDPRGETHVCIPADMEQVVQVRVGDKMSLEPPLEGRFFHFDSIHRLPSGSILWTGDRRLAQPGSASEVAQTVAEWVKGSGAKNVFLGCTPHQPGAWWSAGERAPAVALHDKGFVDVATTAQGLLARRMGEPRLYYLAYASLHASGPLEGWTPVFTSPLGNILLLERRVLGNRMVLTCERGLVEVDLSALPAVSEIVHVELASGLGVIGRVDGGAFAVTCGTVQPWGLEAVKPALLVGAQGETLKDLARAVVAMARP